MRCKKVQISITSALAYENDVFSLTVFFIKQVGIVEEVEDGGEGGALGDARQDTKYDRT